MKTLSVSTEKPYRVHIGAGLLRRCGEELRAVSAAKIAAIVSDDTVWCLYGTTVAASLRKAGFAVTHVTFPAGEENKTLATWGGLLRTLAESRLTRSDLVVALGGGVTGDMAGFAAATYLRGIACAQLPTTLLAAVDSSVGGKTGVDLPEGKNLVGCFHQPVAVLCDTDALSTLPAPQYRAGMAEVIKYGLLGDEAFFDALMQPDALSREELIARCVAMKRGIVERDEREGGLRRLLNLGHTVGHAVERCSRFSVSHGDAVAMGMAAVTRAAVKRDLCAAETLPRLLALLERHELPTQLPYGAAELATAALSDKKMCGDTLRLIVPERVGRCRELPVPAAELADWMKDGGAR